MRGGSHWLACRGRTGEGVTIAWTSQHSVTPPSPPPWSLTRTDTHACKCTGSCMHMHARTHDSHTTHTSTQACKHASTDESMHTYKHPLPHPTPPHPTPPPSPRSASQQLPTSCSQGTKRAGDTKLGSLGTAGGLRGRPPAAVAGRAATEEVESRAKSDLHLSNAGSYGLQSCRDMGIFRDSRPDHE